MVVEVNSDEHVFIISDDGFNSGDLLFWVESVNLFIVKHCSNLAWLPIIESECKCYKYYVIKPLHFCDGQIYKFLPA